MAIRRREGAAAGGPASLTGSLGMQVPWKLIGVAGLAGVAATGVVVARRRRAHTDDLDPDELRARLHRRLDESRTGGGQTLHEGSDPVNRG